MSQDNLIISNGDGATVRAKLNAGMQALASTSKGTSRPATAYAGQPWLDDNTPTSAIWTEYLYDGSDDIPKGRVDTSGNRYIPFNAAHGQCRLVKSGSNLVLQPCNGNVIVVSGSPEIIPSAGVSLAATGTSSSTTYYIYAYMNFGTMTLEYGATGHATASTTGVEVKSGDATRTLVGMARTNASGGWEDSAAQRFVRSWFNRPALCGSAALTANRSTTATSDAEIHAEIRVEFLAWADDAVTTSASGAASRDAATGTVTTTIYYDGATAGAPSGGQSFAANAFFPLGAAESRTLAEGAHTASLYGKNGAAGTATWYTGTTLSVRVG